MRSKILSNEKFIKIVYYFVIIIYIFFLILNKNLDNLDEIWNFSFARNISNGLIPYKDFNVITTPLSMYLNSILLLIKQSLLLFRIQYFIYYILILILIDKIFDMLKIKTIIKYITVFIFLFIISSVTLFDYNLIQFLIILLLVYLQLKNIDYNNKILNIIIPLLSGITIINKHSTGIIICGISFLTLLLNKYYFKTELKRYFILKQILLMIIPVLLFIIYLFIHNNYLEFYDYAILGLTGFATSNNMINKYMFIVLILVYIFITIFLLLNRKDRFIWIIYLYSLASLSFIIPIADGVHLTFALFLPFTILLLVNTSIIKDISSRFIYLLLPVFIVLIVIKINEYNNSLKMNTDVYKNIPVTIEVKNMIEEVNNYVISNDKEVHILDHTSSIFNININRYDKYFDLFMNGNLGIKGEKEVYRIIDNEDNVFLISGENINWQLPLDIVNYVKEKYHYCGMIDRFSIYCK